MPAIFIRQGNFFQRIIDLPAAQNFTILIQQHRAAFKNTGSIEKFGGQVFKTSIIGFPQYADVNRLLKYICWWGGVTRLAYHHVANVPKNQICLAFHQTIGHLHKSNYKDALLSLATVRGFKTGISLATKVFRFLDFHNCGVLDSKISSHLGYPSDINGYTDFLDDLKTIQQQLVKLQILNPVRGNRVDWPLADVEGALFMSL